MATLLSLLTEILSLRVSLSTDLAWRTVVVWTLQQRKRYPWLSNGNVGDDTGQRKKPFKRTFTVGKSQ